MNITIKKAITFIFISFLVLLFGACSSIDSDKEADIKNDVYDIYEQMKSTFKTTADIDDIMSAIKSWCDDNDVAYTDIEDGNMMLSLDATDDYTNSPTATIHCDVSNHDYKHKCQSIAIALAAIKNSERHGQIKVLLSSKTSDIEPKRLPAGTLIDLCHSEKTRLLTGCAVSETLRFDKKISYKKVSGKKAAYRVSISGLKGGDSADRNKKHANPITAIGDLLYSLQQSQLVFQIAGFSGGNAAEEYPKSAEITIVTQSSDAKKLEELIKAKKDSFEESYIDKETDLKFNYAPCKAPSKAYSDTDATDIISLFYTLDDGEITMGEDEDDQTQTAISNIGLIKESAKHLSLDVNVRALYNDVISQLKTMYESSAKLAEFDLSVISTSPDWPFNENSELAERYILAAKQVGIDLDPEWTYADNACAIFYNKKPSLDMISVGTSIDDGTEIAESLILYFESLADPTP